MFLKPPPLFDLSAKIAVVSGAASGMGKASAQALAEVLAAGGEEADAFHRETVHTSSSGAVASPKVFSRTPILSMSER